MVSNWAWTNPARISGGYLLCSIKDSTLEWQLPFGEAVAVQKLHSTGIHTRSNPVLDLTKFTRTLVLSTHPRMSSRCISLTNFIDRLVFGKALRPSSWRERS